MKRNAISGLILIVCGIVYLTQPTIFHRGIWKRTAVSQRLLTPKQNVTYMKVLGGLLILAGSVILALSLRTS